MDREFLESFGVLPEEVMDAILAEHQRALGEREFDHALDSAITAARGRNGTAIRALLDMDSLRASEDPEQAIRQALENLQGECGYLFETTPPPFAPGPGRCPVGRGYTMEELGKLSMEEYRTYRKGRGGKSEQ